ncbi:MAG TPA: biotin-dependent carboxyltransferase family protein [Burkholderiaceae bacterium]|nr:biotin-dependent carboxyltransferase family protein [Burkholderiaceae bacterium]
MSITVIKPGLQSSFQDLGRHGHQHLGVPVSGAMDTRAHRLANLLVGNSADQATLEMTLVGPTLEFDRTACIAITGASLSPTLNGDAVPNNRPLVVKAGDTLAFGERTRGLRAYLAVYGGFDIEPVLGSCSTYLRGKFGGLQGRALQKGDQIGLRQPLDGHDPQQLSDDIWKIKIYLPAVLATNVRPEIRVIMGPHADRFTAQSLEQFLETDFRVSAESERMGYRLKGATLTLSDTAQITSEVTSFGTIQVPPDGNPIILMADRQTTGGYVKIAHVASVDLPLVAQTMPGEILRFQEISLAQAQQLDSQREEAFGRLYQGLADLRKLLGEA